MVIMSSRDTRKLIFKLLHSVICFLHLQLILGALWVWHTRHRAQTHSHLGEVSWNDERGSILNLNSRSVPQVSCIPTWLYFTGMLRSMNTSVRCVDQIWCIKATNAYCCEKPKLRRHGAGQAASRLCSESSPPASERWFRVDITIYILCFVYIYIYIRIGRARSWDTSDIIHTKYTDCGSPELNL